MDNDFVFKKKQVTYKVKYIFFFFLETKSVVLSLVCKVIVHLFLV